MTINLCAVPNISRENTPHFTNETQQTSYFDNRIVSTMTTSYYPPHYANAIKVDSDAFSWEDGINYLFFIYNGRKYFYFIDAIDYTNESVTVLHVTMDVIQTFFFDIRITGQIDRLHIRRLSNNSKFNREYIRENFSNGDFRLNDAEYLTGQAWSNITRENNIFGWFVVQASDKIENTGVIKSYKASVPDTDTGREFYGSYYYYYIPVIDANSEDMQIRHVVNGVHVITRINISEILYNLGKQTRVVNIFFVPGQVFGNAGFTFSHGTDFINIDDSYASVYDVSDKYGITIKGDTNYMGITPLNKTYNFDIITEEVSTWVPQCEPSMLDENYYRLSFGEQTTSATYPLYQNLDNTFYCSYWPELYSGARFYQIRGGTDKSFIDFDTFSTNIPFGIYPDPYCVTVAATTKLSVDLTTDPWIQWQEYNKATIGMAMVSFVANAFTKGMAAQGGINNNNEDIASIRANPNSYDNRYTTLSQFDRPLKSKAQREVTSLTRDNQAIRANQAASITSSSGSLASVATSQWNAWLAPDSPRQFGKFNTDIMSNACNQMILVYKVKDFGRCAFLYHVNGNKVDRFFDDTLIRWYLSPLIATRKAFNIIKFSIAEVSFSDTGLPSTDIILEIKSRFMTGLRLWHYNSTTNNTVVPIGYYSNANWDA